MVLCWKSIVVATVKDNVEGLVLCDTLKRKIHKVLEKLATVKEIEKIYQTKEIKIMEVLDGVSER